jgi:peptide chain release factor 1
MFDKLLSVENKYDELMTKLGTVEVQADAAEYRRSAKTLSELEPLVQKFREYKGVEGDIAGAQELVNGSDAEMRELAREELKTLESRREALLHELKILLIPKDPNDEKNVILEFRAGTGERSEKIRTYNFPQSRITDHRINFTTHRLHDVLEGDPGELIDQLTTFYNAEKLKEATTV